MPAHNTHIDRFLHPVRAKRCPIRTLEWRRIIVVVVVVVVVVGDCQHIDAAIVVVWMRC